MSKQSGKVQAKSWQPPAVQTASFGFSARPFPEIARKEEGKQASLDLLQMKENQPGGMIDNINRSLASASPPAPLPILGLLGVQAKLTLGTVGDVYEQEADRVARQVVDKIHSDPFRASNTTSEGESIANGGEAGRVQRQITVRAAGDAGGEISSEWEGELVRAKGGGQPMSPTVREPMERAFGADFGGVRVHTGAQADMLARSIQAKAFTTGQDVFFRQGAYEPGSRGGQELIAHELTHVGQQNGRASSSQFLSKDFSSYFPIQRKMLKNNTEKGIYEELNVMNVKEIIGYTVNNLGEIPTIDDTINSMVNDDQDRKFDDDETYDKKMRNQIFDNVLSGYVRNVRPQINSDLSRILKEERIKTLALYVTLKKYDILELNQLIADVLQKPKIDGSSVEDTVKKAISEVSDSDQKNILKNAEERNNFLKGRDGEMMGLIGELRALKDTLKYSGDARVKLGHKMKYQTQPSGEDKGVKRTTKTPEQEVDIYYEKNGKIYCIEVAATVDKLRDKLNDGRQMESYNRLKKENSNIQLIYAVAEKDVKIRQIFGGEHLVKTLDEQHRTLRMDGEEFTHIRLLEVKQQIKYITEEFMPEAKEKATKLIGDLTLSNFLNKDMIQWERQVWNAAAQRDTQIEANFDRVEKVREGSGLLKTSLEKAIKVMEIRTQGDLNQKWVRVKTEIIEYTKNKVREIEKQEKEFIVEAKWNKDSHNLTKKMKKIAANLMTVAKEYIDHIHIKQVLSSEGGLKGYYVKLLTDASKCVTITETDVLPMMKL